MKIQGRIIKIGETQQVSDTFKKRDFVVEYTENPQYPEYISFQLIQERCMLIDSFKEEDTVEVSFNLKGRKWIAPDGETKFFNSLQAWRVEKNNDYHNNINHQAEKSMTTEEDDLPF